MLVIPLILGCGGGPESIDREAFAEEFAPLACDRYKECSKGGYEADYDDRNQCEADQLDAWEELAEGFEAGDCAYSETGAAELWVTLRDMECGDWYAGDVLAELDVAFECE